MKLNFDNSFARLPKLFYTRLNAEGFAKDPELVHFNWNAAGLLDIKMHDIGALDILDYFSGSKNLASAEPLASVYAGHQFGYFVPQLGDGRALLLGQVRNQKSELWDIQLKGAGRTPYSRFGDGRAVMRSSIREYLCSEAMNALSIPTTRALCLLASNEKVIREEIEPGAILTRLAQTHIRFGHFEFFYHSDQPEAVRQLADYVIDEYFPEFKNRDDKYLLWFSQIVERTARLIAKWQSVGFAHGVMNTDNMSILGLTIDYGPFGFMEAFDPRFICNHSDETGRYAFDQQPGIGQWNLYALAYALQPLFPLDAAKDSISSYGDIFRDEFSALMARKLGFKSYQSNNDDKIIRDLLILMQEHRADYTNNFRYLSEAEYDAWLALFSNAESAQRWLQNWKARADDKPSMLTVNPKYILRNWVAETVIRAVEDKKNYKTFDDIFTILRKPFDAHKGFEHFAQLAPEEFKNLCVSCSS